MQKYILGTLLLFSPLFTLLDAFIIPQEIPSLLSLVYSNIPPIKKGTDSRIGFGYRLGDHADFQVQFELGPQKETQKIGTDSTRKRNVRPADEFQLEKEIRKDQLLAKRKMTSSQSWLENWLTQLKENKQEEPVKESESDMYMRRTPMISETAANQLSKLYESSKDKPVETEVKDEVAPAQ